MGFLDALKLADAIGSLGVAGVAIVLLLRLDRVTRTAAAALAILLERTHGLRVVQEGRRLTVTIDPPIAGGVPEPIDAELTGQTQRIRSERKRPPRD